MDVSQVWTSTESHEADHYSPFNLELGVFVKIKMHEDINSYPTYLCMSNM
jgi:hypothetical protein